MKGLILVACLLGLVSAAYAQEIPFSADQQLEDLAQNQESVPEDDSFIEELEHYRKHPLNINLASRDDLASFFFLTALQIESLVRYRELLGYLVSIHELQAVPGWDIASIRKILPYISVIVPVSLKDGLLSHSQKGEHQLLLRTSAMLEKTRGLEESSYQGDPYRVFFRYRYQYKNRMQWGITGDKDAGEGFFGRYQQKGFDFYSAHLIARNIGFIESIALGDFQVNMGQGLIHWQGMAFGKGAELNSIKRQSAIIRPYSSAGEYNFMRGAAITLKKKSWRITALFSSRKQDANLSLDSINEETRIRSFITSGYHRTLNELADKNNISLLTAGGNISYKQGRWSTGLNALYYRFSHPVEKRDEPYNSYAFKGSQWGNLSIDHGCTLRNLHLFGEWAIDRKFNPAFVEGIMLSAGNDVDLAFLLRIISPAYQSIYGNAFTENSFPTNETGVYSMLTIRPATGVKIDAYADVFRFPWLKYRVDASSAGADYFLQLTYVPTKHSSLMMRFRVRNRQVNDNLDGQTTKSLVRQSSYNWRGQVNITVSPMITMRSRAELNWFRKKGSEMENGFMVFADILFRPVRKSYGLTFRAAIFDTEGYDTRIYAYENSVLYNYSISALSGKGFRYYLNAEYDLGEKTTFWLRWAQTILSGIASAGAGREELGGRFQSDWTIQCRWSF